ncbi:hypothetical protein SteCoe_13427 [Stentor coeruleus]|uniref:Uncharacterized protein n=1 Tax=Stentor coeruleus TaxID=5963 RepID=A0A1R2C8C7_9CILI|nr:hypothetical protein SteCoe_13427 [Stentor coeruleus]
MEILPFSDIIKYIVYSSVYLLLSIFWVCFICTKGKRYTTIMHVLLISIFLTRSLVIFFLLTSYMKEVFSNLSILWECIEGIIKLLEDTVLITCFYFVAIGFGCCNIHTRGFDILTLNGIFIPTYSCKILIIIYPVVGAAIYPLVLPIVYLSLIKLIEHSLEYFREYNNEDILLDKIKLLSKVKTVIFTHTFITAIYYTCFTLINTFNHSLYYLDLLYEVAEFVVLLIFFYVVRPAHNQGFTHDFLFQIRRTEIAQFLQALVPLGFNVSKNKINLALLPRESLTFAIAISINS